jgi:hypothetical protein
VGFRDGAGHDRPNEAQGQGEKVKAEADEALQPRDGKRGEGSASVGGRV